MNVGEFMTSPAVVAAPKMSHTEAMKLLHERRIRRLPIVDDGVLVGIVSERDLLRAAPSPATTLTIWEQGALLDDLPLRELMTRDVIVVHPDTPIQNAAQLMVDYKIGGLPVVQGGHVVGIITETDIFRVFSSVCGQLAAHMEVRPVTAG